MSVVLLVDESAALAFVARKLTVHHPEHPQIRQLYTYECIRDGGQAPQLISYFLNEEKAYALWAALVQVEQAPLRMISPPRTEVSGTSRRLGPS